MKQKCTNILIKIIIIQVQSAKSKGYYISPQFWWALFNQTPYRSGGFDCLKLLLSWDVSSEVLVMSGVSSPLECSSSWLGSLFKSRLFLLTTPVDVRTWYDLGPCSFSTSPETPWSDIYTSSPGSKLYCSDVLCLLS